MSEEDAELLFKTRDPARAIERGHALGVETVVLKLGERGAVGSTAGAFHVADAAPVQSVVDPVGAGDGFNAGFVAGMVMSGNLAQSLALGNYVGARAVEQVGEHTYPYVKDLPAALRTTVEGGLNLEAGPSDASALSRPSTFAGDAPPGAGRSEDARHQA
jgi:2-dehydro-3-deoxygluconokinase